MKQREKRSSFHSISQPSRQVFRTSKLVTLLGLQSLHSRATTQYCPASYVGRAILRSLLFCAPSHLSGLRNSYFLCLTGGMELLVFMPASEKLDSQNISVLSP